MTKWLRFYVFTFFEKPKNMTFYVFLEMLHTFSGTLVHRCIIRCNPYSIACSWERTSR